MVSLIVLRAMKAKTLSWLLSAVQKEILLTKKINAQINNHIIISIHNNTNSNTIQYDLVTKGTQMGGRISDCQ